VPDILLKVNYMSQSKRRLWSGGFALLSISTFVLAFAQDESKRAIISDDFTNSRPKSATQTKPARKSRSYRLASKPTTGSSPADWVMSAIGVTVWKLDPATNVSSRFAPASSSWQPGVARRVESDTAFHEGDLLRFSIESPRNGYLYVINRDWLSEGRYGATNLIFPASGEDNRLNAGRLISIPAENKIPFRASPQPNQSAELLTILITSEPLRLPSFAGALPISMDQLTNWENKWASPSERFEMNGGSGELRTQAEQQASISAGLRQLTRADPPPQTIYVLKPKRNDGIMFNVILSYGR
jgi:hypothetical protein